MNDWTGQRREEKAAIEENEGSFMVPCVGFGSARGEVRAWFLANVSLLAVIVDASVWSKQGPVCDGNISE